MSKRTGLVLTESFFFFSTMNNFSHFPVSFTLSRSQLANDVESLIVNITNDNEIGFRRTRVLHTHA